MSDYIRSQEESTGVEKQEDPVHNSMIADIFNAEDDDRDGFISHAEFNGPKDEL